jgi:tricarballylate dehydrogenase
MALYDVVVVGGGNAAFCAAHAAREYAERVLIVEKAPPERAGGNSYFTAGAFRTAHHGLAQLRPLLPDLTDEQAAVIDLPPYSEERFLADLRRLTEGRCDPELSAILVGDSFDTIRWMRAKGVRWDLLYARQSYRVGARIQFWGDLAIGAVGGGVGLMERHLEAARAAGIEIRYRSPVVELSQGEDGVAGVICMTETERRLIEARAVVLASGGFEADPRLRAAYLGPNWDLARVRGSEYNTGEVLHLALAAGAQPHGHWSGCHSIAWDAQAPATGDWTLTNRLSRQNYPLGIVVNREAKRFLDEGADFRNFTYAKYGAEILKQPGGIAYQLFDARTLGLLSAEDYGAHGTTRVEADSIRGLAEKLGLDPAALEGAISEFNAAVQPGEFNPAIKDGKRTAGIDPPKSNWAQPLDRPPFVAFPVTCGITFTYGGLRVDADSRVIAQSGRPIPGLFAAGELVGGLFYHNYPGGSGLMAGSVFGRRAGAAAGRRAGEAASRTL